MAQKITIEITEEVGSQEEMVDLLNHIATMVKDGYSSGYQPTWSLTIKDDGDKKESSEA